MGMRPVRHPKAIFCVIVSRAGKGNVHEWV
jgi:hypothetical protein